MSDPFIEYAAQLVGRSVAAARALRTFNQEQVDRIVEAVFEAAWAARADLARLAHEETGMGTVEDKTVKNAWAALATRDELRSLRTVGVISDDEETGIAEIAEPVGPILGTIPVTNPTSTVIFKALTCLKTRNPLIFSAHRGARKCVKEAARVLAAAAEAAGAPPDSIQNITRSQAEYLQAVMRHRDLALIVATGTGAIVKTARETGTPTLGVGPGNVPVYVHESADAAAAARSIVRSKTFDHGTICASEQAVIVERAHAARLRAALEAEGCYYCTEAQAEALAPVCLDLETRKMRADVVGQSAPVIANRAGFDVPASTRVLVAAPAGIGPEHPLSAEILAPVLAWYEVDDYAAARRACEAVLSWGGIGHTLGVYTEDESVVADFSELPASRILVNQGTTFGAIGGWVNNLPASLTLSCGPAARNILNENITARHLLQVKRVARRREKSELALSVHGVSN
jgi:acetaldehyde dehydrogenase/alcohol dehydrogenase